MPLRRRLLRAALPLLLICTAAQAQRLPAGAHPEHYTLALTPDLTAATFTGDETIDVVMDRPAKSITLNAAEIHFLNVTAVPTGSAAGAPSQSATVSLDETKDQATFNFPQTLTGKITLHITYTGILNDKLRGFYLSKTPKRSYAVTQFEPTDARRAFPSFDEPALKATFDIALTVDSADTVISNTNVIEDKPAATAGKHTLRFATTPKMSTYLVAFLVGDFECTTGKADGIPIRACASPDKVRLTKFAVDAAAFSLHYYDEYFGIKYPMPKLDMIALPDFEAGAMENFGCITYRETDLLVDEKSGNIPAMKRVAEVVAHEISHQWFGDMVTMHWWDNLWLNEGFASWMEHKAAGAWHPEWNFGQDDAVALNDTLDYDAQGVTRPIHNTVNTPAEINQMFDRITYEKAGAVIGMVENYLGEDAFRTGVHNYLQAHLYATATAEDFWSAQTAASHKPVDKIMQSFVEQPGVPLLTLTQTNPQAVGASEKRFSLATPEACKDGACARAEQAAAGEWSIPVCFKASGQASDKPVCEVLTPQTKSLALPAGAPFVFANAASKGYYRVAYTPQQYAAILASAQTALSPAERVNLVGDRWALMRSGSGSVGDFLDLSLALKQEPSAVVLAHTLDKVIDVDQLIATGVDRDRFEAVIRAQFGPVYNAMGGPQRREPFDHQQNRAVLFALLGQAKDPMVLAQARQMTAELFDGKRPSDPALIDAAVALAAVTGNTDLYDRMMIIVQKATAEPGLEEEVLHTLSNFTDPALVTRTLEYVTSGQVRNQDSASILGELLSQSDTQDQAWTWIRAHWPAVQAQLTTNSGSRVVAATHNFCTVQRRDEVKSFFAAHPVEAADVALGKSLQAIDDCIRLRATQAPRLKLWLDAHAPTPAPAK